MLKQGNEKRMGNKAV